MAQAQDLDANSDSSLSKTPHMPPIIVSLNSSFDFQPWTHLSGDLICLYLKQSPLGFLVA